MGLSSAYYLINAGHRVTVLDKEDFLDNCSYGNAGYVCPSHFIPLATPGIVSQGMRWMLNAKSPFYVQPGFNRALIDWGLKFIRSASAEKVEAAAVPLRDIALLSKKEYESWTSKNNLLFSYEQKGLLEIFQTDEKAAHAYHTVEKGIELGLDVIMLNQHELRAMEPQTTIHALGAIYFKCDAHLYPNLLMNNLISYLKAAGVRMVTHQRVTGFEKQPGGNIKKVLTADGSFDADEVVLATGSWSRELALQLDIRLPLMPGRGYSITLEDSPYKINHPAVLMEGRVALTPMDGNKIRFGGTMEITSTQTAPKYKRVQGILDSVKRYFPEFDIPMPSPEKIWYGFRPCSADGLPYIGRSRKCGNIVIATGHAMIGLSLGAGTGKLVSEIIEGGKTSMDISPFAVERFG